MGGFLYKDFFTARAALIFTAVSYAVMTGVSCFVNVGNDAQAVQALYLVLMYMPFFILDIVRGEYFGDDERQVWCNFALAAPHGRRNQVLAKYLVTLIINLSLFLLMIVAERIILAVQGVEAESMWKVFMIFVCINLFVAALEIPFLIGFGKNKGVMVKANLITIVVLILFIIMLFADFSFIDEADVPGWIFNYINSDKPKDLFVIIPCVVAALFGLSAFISVLVYRRGTQNYEQ